MSSKPNKERYNEPATGETKDMPGQSRQTGQQQGGQPQQKDNPYDKQGGRGSEQNKPQR